MDKDEAKCSFSNIKLRNQSVERNKDIPMKCALDSDEFKLRNV